MKIHEAIVVILVVAILILTIPIAFIWSLNTLFKLDIVLGYQEIIAAIVFLISIGITRYRK